MAIVTTQQVIINVAVTGAQGANQLLGQLGVHTGKAGQTASASGKNMLALGNIAQTLTKALISMMGVLVAFNLLVTLPQKIMMGMVALGKTIIEMGEEISRSITQTAGLLASFATFGDTAEKSFNNAIQASRKLQMTFAQLAATSLATAEDMQKGFQVFVARGGLGMAGGDLDKAARTAAFLVNMTIALTGEQQKERQIYTEIDAFLSGQARAGAVVARLLKAQVGDLKTYLELHRQQGDLLEDLQKRFGGLNQAAARLGTTLTGSMTSIKGSLGILNEIAYRNGAFPTLQNITLQWRDTLQSAVLELGRVKNMAQGITPNTMSILRAFGALQVAIEEIVKSINAMVSAIMGVEGPAQMLEKIAGNIMKIALTASAAFKAIAVGQWSTDLEKVIQQIQKYGTLQKEGLTALESIGSYIQKMAKADVFAAEDASKISVMYENAQQAYKDYEEAVTNGKIGQGYFLTEFKNRLADLMDELQPYMATSPFGAFGKIWDQELAGADQKIKKMVSMMLMALSETNNAQTKIQSLFKSTADEADKAFARALNRLEKLKDEYYTTLFQQTGIDMLVVDYKRLAAARDLREELGAYPELLKEALSLNQKLLKLEEKITIEKAWQKAHEIYINQLKTSTDRQTGITEDYISLMNELNSAYIATTRTEDQYTAAMEQLNTVQERINLSTKIMRQEQEKLAGSILSGMMTGLFNEAELKALVAQYDALSKKLEQIMMFFDRLKVAITERAAFRQLAGDVKQYADEISTLLIRNKDLTEDLDYLRGTGQDLRPVMQDLTSNLKDIQAASQSVTEWIGYLNARLSNVPEGEQTSLRELIKQLEALDRQLKISERNTKEALGNMRVLMEDMTAFLREIWLQWGNGFVNTTEMIKETALAFFIDIAKNTGQLLAQVFQAAFEGESIIKVIKKFIGQALISLGIAAVNTGVIALIANALGGMAAVMFGMNPGAAIALIAAGTAAIAAGAALGASGGGGTKTAPQNTPVEPEPIYIRQQDVETQQGIQTVLRENTYAINRLNDEVTRLSRESGDVLVSRAVSRNPNMVVRPVMRAAANSFTVQRALGGALVGSNA